MTDSDQKVGEQNGLQIPHDRLEDSVLRGMIEEYVLREGTDYGQAEYTLQEKVERVRLQLVAGKVALLFDPDSETINLRKL